MTALSRSGGKSSGRTCRFSPRSGHDHSWVHPVEGVTSAGPARSARPPIAARRVCGFFKAPASCSIFERPYGWPHRGALLDRWLRTAGCLRGPPGASRPPGPATGASRAAAAAGPPSPRSCRLARPGARPMLEPVAEEDRAGGRDSTMNGFDGALRAERITNARRATLMRVVIVGTFLANYLSLVFLVRAQPPNAGTALFPGYFLAALLILALTRRSGTAADVSWYFIPFFDMPLLFAFELVMIGARGVANVAPSYLFLTGLYLLLILFTVLSLRARVVLVASATAMALSLGFAWRAEIEGRFWPLLSVMLLAAFTGAAFYALRRLHALLRRAVDEQTRLERLKRYFSPQVAAVLEEQSAGETGTATRTITVLFGDIRGFTAITHD